MGQKNIKELGSLKCKKCLAFNKKMTQGIAGILAKSKEIQTFEKVTWIQTAHTGQSG